MTRATLAAAALALAACAAPPPPGVARGNAPSLGGSASGPGALLPALPGAGGAVMAPSALGATRAAPPGLLRADSPPSRPGGRPAEFSGQATPFWAAPGAVFPPPRPNLYFFR